LDFPGEDQALNRGYRWQVWAVLGAGLLLTGIAWHATRLQAERETAARFAAVTSDTRDAIESRVRAYSEILIGVRALYLANDGRFAGQEFTEYVAGLDLPRRYPGIQVIHYAERVTGRERAAFEAAVRSAGESRFSIKPPGERDEYVVVRYVAPRAGNEAALGLDLAGDPVRLQSLSRARVSGELAATGPIALALDPSRYPGFAMRLPVYQRGAPTATVAQRRAGFAGIISASFVVIDLMRGLFSESLLEQIHVRVHDAGPGNADGGEEPPSEKNLMFDSNRLLAERSLSGAAASATRSLLTGESSMEVGGRRWNLYFTARPGFGSVAERWLPWVVLTSGIAISLLLAGLVRSLQTSRARAIAWADRVTADLRASEVQLTEEQNRMRGLIEAIPNPIFFKSTEGHYLGVNKAWETLFGQSRVFFVGKTVRDLFSHKPEIAARLEASDQELWRSPGSQVYETTITTGGGENRDVVYYKATYTHPGGAVAGLVGMIVDVTERKATEQRYRALFDNAAVGITTVDLRGIITEVNQRFLDMLGYSGGELIGRNVAEITFPEDRPQGLRSADEAMLDKAAVVAEQRFLCRDGRVLWVRRTVSAIRGKDGKPDYLVNVVEDITDRKQEELRRTMEHAVTRALAQEDSLVNLFPVVIRDICQNMGWEFGVAWVWDHEAQGLKVCASWGAEAPEVREFVAESMQRTIKPKVSEQQGLVRRTYASGEAVWLNDVAPAQGFRRANLIWSAGLHGAFAFPLLRGTEVVGVMEFYHRGTREPEKALIGTAQSIGRQIGQYMGRREAEEALKFVAGHDGLTKLLNRMMFNQRLEHALALAQRNKSRLAVLFIDLDRFKVINDTLGHEAGDILLREVAARLLGQLRSTDTVARLGGDEFVVLIENVTDPLFIGGLARKLIEALSASFALSGGEYNVTASIGVSTYPDDGGDAQTLLKHADIAMYRSKEQGRNTFQFYAAQMNVHSVERLTMESGLRRALERGELVLHYQPILDLRTRRVTGMEALVRWQHPESGLVPPAQFIAIAEESGLIVPIGAWVLDTACATQSAWHGLGLPRIAMSVNLSPRQFLYGDLVRDIERLIAKPGHSAESLKLEITEGMVMQNPKRAVLLIRTLKEMGLKIAIDDFGTGYSSLAYLRHFPIDTLKIDRSFILDTPGDAGAVAITQAIIAMAHNLGLDVTAEGVETAEQFEFLLQHDCDQMQGYYFSKPLSAADAAALLQKNKI
jgi:diguanylate cyclase (GGDEF)-like protein/PAS domain S-box-containing protein